jgi:hypothetical protein
LITGKSDIKVAHGQHRGDPFEEDFTHDIDGRRCARGLRFDSWHRSAPFMAPADTDPAALRAVDSLAVLPDDLAAAAEEIQRRREESGFSYFVFGADFADALAPLVAELTGH